MKRIMQYTAIVMLTILAVTVENGRAEAARTGVPASDKQSPSTNVFVSFHCSTENFVSAVSGAGGIVRELWPSIGLAVVSISDAGVVRSLESVSGIESVIPDRNVRWVEKLVPGLNILVQSDPTPPEDGRPESAEFFDIQRSLAQISVAQAWAAKTSETTTRVGILDTGISPDHVDLQGKYDLDASVNLSDSDPGNSRNFIDRHYHGTHVSAIIASNNLGIAGIAQQVKLVGVKVLDDEGSASFSNIIAGIMYAVEQAHVDIINLSIGAHELDASYEPQIAALSKAVQFAGEKGVMVVVAAGNEATSLEGGIALLARDAANVVVVGASEHGEESVSATRACYSNYGSDVRLSAPGGIIDCSTGSFSDMTEMVISALAPSVARSMDLPNPDSWYVFAAGTEVAASHVTGVAAMLQSAACSKSPADLIARLKATANSTQTEQIPEVSNQLAEINASLAVRR